MSPSGGSPFLPGPLGPPSATRRGARPGAEVPPGGGGRSPLSASVGGIAALPPAAVARRTPAVRGEEVDGCRLVRQAVLVKNQGRRHAFEWRPHRRDNAQLATLGLKSTSQVTEFVIHHVLQPGGAMVRLQDDLWFFFSKSERTGFHLVLGGCCFLLYWIFGTKCQGLPFKIRSKFLAFPGISNFSPCICFQDMNFRPGQHRFASSFDVQLVLRYFLLRQVSRVHDRTTSKT